MDKDIETLITALYVKIDDEYGGMHSDRDAGPVGACQRQAGRAGGAGGDVGGRCRATRRARDDPADRGQGLRRRRVEKDLAAVGVTLLRPSRKREAKRFGEPVLKKVRQLIESVNDTLKGPLDLEFHGGRSCEGVAIRVAQRVLALAAAIWFNNKSAAPVTRSLIAFDH